MNTRYLKIGLVVLALLFAQGCSFYAGFDVKQQTPKGTKMVLDQAYGTTRSN